MNDVIQYAQLPAPVRAEVQRLSRAPAVAWPTLLLGLCCIAGYLASDWLGWTRVIPLWAAALVNGVMGYCAFSVIHDSIHRAVSTRVRLNDWAARLILLLETPWVNLELFRWAHIQHHRHSGGGRDPDQWVQGPWWQLPLRWMFIDVFYLYYVVARGDAVARKHFRSTRRYAAVCAVLALALTALGHGPEVLMLWLIPSRISQLLLGFAFFWLPHAPHDTAQADNFTRATTVRLGHEWLLSPLLQWQNYHLIHHLLPATPFYNNRRLWLLLEPQLRRHELAIQHGFAIQPTIHPAQQGA
ncbi:MAG: fatty acid desaturase [Nevskia sp.]|nr:fatty acid desaturase [Nevskia sp.]